MSKSKHFDKICIAFMILALIITACFMNGEKLGLTLVVDEDAETHSDDSYFTANDLDADLDTSDSTIITLSDEGSKISGYGAYVLDNSVVISESGTYVISGELTDGSITVDANDNSKIWILFDGVTITNTTGSCLTVENADKVFLTLAEGSDNVLTTEGDEADESDTSYDTIFTHDDLTINGSGTLSLVSTTQCGIDANDDLVITGGSITINSAGDAIHVNDSFRLCEADITIDSGDDAIHSDTSIYIESGTVLANSCYEGLEAYYIDICGGDITIYPTDDGINANSASNSFGMFTESTDTSSSSDEELSYINISGGNITIINESGMDADGLDSNGNITISGGMVFVSFTGSGTNLAIDYGSESGGTFTIDGGTVVACGSSSMLEEISDASTQASITYVLNNTTENAVVTLTDSDSSTVMEYTIPCDFSAITLSSSDLSVGETYTLTISDTSGETSEEITFEDTTYSNSTGNTMTGGMGGGMGGGMQRGNRGEQNFSNMSEESDTTAEAAEMPEIGEAPDMSEMRGNGDMFEMSETTDNESETTESTATSLTEASDDYWLMLGGSVAVLLLGLIIAVGFKRRR